MRYFSSFKFISSPCRLLHSLRNGHICTKLTVTSLYVQDKDAALHTMFTTEQIFSQQKKYILTTSVALFKGG